MSWGGWSDFVAMGGYGLYVWGSYAVTVVVLAAEIASVRRRRRTAVRAVKRLHAAAGDAR